jgi:Ubiquitin-activating enzyme active site
MFPEETLHCVEWARDKFGKIFDLRIKRINEIINDIDNFEVQSDQETK